MAQRRIFNFDEDDSTFLLNIRDIAAVPPGLYRGFDYDNTSSGTVLKLKHTLTGYSEVDEALTIATNLGYLKTPQGVGIIEDDIINITLTNNAAGGQKRFDLVIAEHEFVDISGGIDATYGVILGTVGSGVYPALTTPAKQVIIGYIEWPAGATAITTPNVIYKRADPAIFNGDADLMRRSIVQAVTGDKNFYKINEMSGTMTLVSGVLSSTVDRNTYVLPYISDAWLAVDQITLPFETKSSISGEISVFKIMTNQNLVFGTGVNVSALTSLAGYVHVKKGETITVADVSNTIFGGFPDHQYMVLEAGSVNKDTINKMYGQIVGGVGNINNVSGDLIPDGTGNYYQLNANFSIHNISRILGTDAHADTGQADNEGGIICVKVVNTGTGTTIDLFNGIAASGAYKSITTNTGTTVKVNNGDYLYFLEQKNTYTLLFRTGTVVNLDLLHNAYHALVQNEEKVYTKTVSTGWKILADSAYDVSTKVLTVTNDANSFQISVPTSDNNGYLTDIKLLRDGAPVTAPDGLIINVRFLHTVYVGGISVPFYLSLNNVSSNIRSVITGQTLTTGGSSNSLFIQDGSTTTGDIYTFRKTNGVWDIIGMNLLPSQMPRIIALEGSVFNDNWISPTLINGFSAYTTSGFGTAPKYIKKLTTVELKGAVTISSLNAAYPDDVIFVLPVSYRPTGQKRIPIHVQSNVTAGYGWLTIYTNGDVEVKTSISGAAGTLSTFFLDGVSFNLTT